VLGNIYKFILRAFNAAGSVDSSAISVALASLPAKPTVPPSVVPTGTNPNQLQILIGTFDATNNGGSPILNY
jgi:hypothetical protein